MFKFSQTQGYVRNSQDQIVDLKGASGNPTQTAVISASQVATAVTITTGKNTLLLYNQGTAAVYFGASDVSSTTGFPIFAGTGFTFDNVNSDFAVYLICAAGLTATVRRVEM